MDAADALAVITEALRHTVPDLDISAIDPGAELTVEAGLDSMSFLSMVTQISERTGQDIPERDHPQLISLAGLTTYLVERSAGDR